MASILVVDDDKLLCETLLAKLHRSGHQAGCVHTLTEAMSRAEDDFLDVILLDVRMPDGNGLLSLSRLKKTHSCPEIIIITGEGDADGAEMAIKCGAWDYVQKSSVVREIMLPINRALQYRAEKNRITPLPVSLKRKHIVGSSPQLQRCLELMANAAMSDVSVLITGETGTGKELFARAIHENSHRAENSFVVVDCAAIPENLVESILFGHVRGAFTGADRDRNGLIARADGGTLFLDEVGELPLATQKSFLRVLQEHRFTPVGDNREVESRFRLLAATNRDLEQLVRSGDFRQDLLYRLQSFYIPLPPLRERQEDIRELATSFGAMLCQRYGHETKCFSPEFLDALCRYEWPGNVRELFQVMDRVFTVAFHHQTLYPHHLPDNIRIPFARAAFKKTRKSPTAQDENQLPLNSWANYKNNMEADYIKRLMLSCKGNIAEACQHAGLSRARLYQLVRKHGVSSK